MCPRPRSLPLLLTLLPLQAAGASPPLPGQTGALYGLEPGGLTGALVVPTGDVDHDGSPDLLVGAPGAQLLYLLLNSAQIDGSISSQADLVIDLVGEVPLPWTTVAVTAGDLNHDDEIDLVIGLTADDGSGQVSIFHRAGFWLAGALTLLDADVTFAFPAGTEAGVALAIGPNPADGDAPSLFIGAPGAADGYGEVYALRGAELNTGFYQPLETSLISTTWTPATLLGARAGSALYTGADLDHDQVADLVIGAPGAAGGGAAFLVLSGGSSLSTDLEQHPYFVLETPHARAGAALSSADIDGDQLHDLLIGAPGDSSIPGQVFLILDRERFFAQEPLEAADMVLTGGAAGDGLGTAIAGLPDLDGDALGEMLIGAPGAATGQGQVGLILGSREIGGIERLEQASILFTGSAPGGRLGYALTPPDPMAGISWFGAPLAPGDSLEAPAGEVYGISLRLLAEDGDGDGSSPLKGDCDDVDPERGPTIPERCNEIDDDCDGEIDDAAGDAATWYADVDGDGYGDPMATLQSCQRPEGYVTSAGDCSDSEPERYPGAEEVCDGRDNNCDGDIPEPEFDLDGDGHLTCQGDCNDGNPLTYPGATEQCDGLDNDCDGNVPELEADADADGFRGCSLTPDCDDSTADRYPGAPERCDGIDNDCSGQPLPTEVDADGDTYRQCSRTPDCDDTRLETHPGAEELCDGLDNDCDGQIPAEEDDADEDGFRACDPDPSRFDCDDSAPEVHPDAEEVCDGLDNDCDERIDGLDADGDGFPACAPETTELDCDDSRIEVHPGAVEQCDGLDNDCDGTKLELEVDEDGDGHLRCGGDCDDDAPLTYPGATEQCDARDNNCDQAVPGDELDGDSDGYSGCAGDCDDKNPAVHPGVEELCNNKDDNCDGRIDETELTWYPDRDSDGFGVTDEGLQDCERPSPIYVSTPGDCDDFDPDVNPGAEEVCDGQDNNCDSLIDNAGRDKDRDGFTLCQDCDDNDKSVNPRADEICADQIDNNCDGQIDVGPDDDDDGVTTCEGDCDDTEWTINPRQQEVTGNEIDEDCDGEAEDVDGDGFSAPEDCRDDDPSIHPDQEDVPNDEIDSDCSGADATPSPDVWIDGPGIGCGALSDVDEVIVACSTTPGSPAGPRGPGVSGIAGLFVITVAIVNRRRRAGR